MSNSLKKVAPDMRELIKKYAPVEVSPRKIGLIMEYIKLLALRCSAPKREDE